MRIICVLLVAATLLSKVFAVKDIYWEDEDETSKEFLEVDIGEPDTGGHLERIKRGFFDWFSSTTPPSTTTSTTTANYDIKDDESSNYNEDLGNENDKDDVDNEIEGGSGSEGRVESEIKEKTLRVTFVVHQPYRQEYSNRDSEEFQVFSKSLAEAVNQVFYNKTGTHNIKASLVRIQSRPSDDFTCKVTMEIVTNGYEDINRIANILKDHINKTMKLASIIVNDNDFNAIFIDSGLTARLDICAENQIKCDGGRCLPVSMRCDGKKDCLDGHDEDGCPSVFDDSNEQTNESFEQHKSDEIPSVEATPSFPTEKDADTTTTSYNAPDADCKEKFLCEGSSISVCIEKRCNGFDDCPNRFDELNCNDNDQTSQTTVACSADEFQCDQNRCISRSNRCDGRADCDDRTDEIDCRRVVEPRYYSLMAQTGPPPRGKYHPPTYYAPGKVTGKIYH